MAMFDFSDLFAEYEIPFQRITQTDGDRDYSKGGQYIAGADLPPIEMTGMVVPLSNEDLRFEGNGRYTRQDLKIYVQSPQFLSENDVVVVRGVKYRVMPTRAYQPEYADFNIYIVRRTDINEEDII